MIDHTAVVAVVQIQTNPRDKADIFAVTYSQHTLAVIHIYLAAKLSEMSFLTQVKEIIGGDFYS